MNNQIDRDAVANAAEILDILTSNIPRQHDIYAWAMANAKQAVAELYAISRRGQMELF